MEMMKQSGRKLAIRLLTLIAMVFTLILCMGTEVAEAATTEYTPTLSCPVSKVEFVPQSNGQYNLKVTVNLDVFKNAGYSSGDYYYDLTVKNNSTNMRLAGEQGNIGVNGEVTFEYKYGQDSNPNYNLTQNQEIAIEFSFFDQNVQLDPDPVNNPTKLNCTSPSLFTGFTAKYKATVSSDIVELDYDKYYGYGDDYKYNIYLRENPATGMIRTIGDVSAYHYRSDSQYKPATNYIYYVAKDSVLQKVLPDFWKRVGSKEMTFSKEEKAKLRTISAYASVTVPGPRIVKVGGLKVSPGVRSASLTWKYSYETITPNVTGFYVRVYSSNGSLYKTYKITAPKSTNCSATCAIPYKGTYYFSVAPYYVYSGVAYEGTKTAKVSCKSKSLSAASGSVTKISDKKVRITIKKATGSTGTIVYQYTGGKWVKLGSTKGSSFTTTKNKAGKKKYKFLSYITEMGNTYKGKYSRACSPKANVGKFSYSNYPSSYPSYKHYWRPTTISYSGGKVVVAGKFINTHLYDLNYVKIKLTIKCQGKVIGTKVVSSGRIKSNGVKKMKVKLSKSKKGYDLRAGGIDWDYTVISWR